MKTEEMGRNISGGKKKITKAVGGGDQWNGKKKRHEGGRGKMYQKHPKQKQKLLL